jgi:ATP-dependent RNA helicase DDX49/DBP8
MASSKVEDVAPALTLDPMEVMKAMLAQKGKGKQVESDEEESEGEDQGSGSNDGSDEDEEQGSSDDETKEDVSSEAESSRSAELRQIKKQRSVSPPTASRVAPTISRVKIEPKTESGSPFDQTKPPAVTSFESLGMSKPLISALATIGIKKPTEIQAACVGAIMSGRDCIGGAKTGSGKTLAFALPIVERIARDPFGVWAVVLTPTRYVIAIQCILSADDAKRTRISIDGTISRCWQTPGIDDNHHRRRDGHDGPGQKIGCPTPHHRRHPWPSVRLATKRRRLNRWETRPSQDISTG